MLLRQHVLDLLPCHCCALAKGAVSANVVFPVKKGLPVMCKDTSLCFTLQILVDHQISGAGRFLLWVAKAIVIVCHNDEAMLSKHL